MKYRKQKDTDDDFLFRLYASTRAEEMKLSGWDENQIETFLKFQFTAQKNHYEQQYKNARFEIILIHNKEAGRLYVHKTDHEIRIVDISLLPEFRGKGYGTKILKKIIEEAQQLNLPLRLSVLVNNPAGNLYKHLGFVRIAENFPYLEMEKNP